MSHQEVCDSSGERERLKQGVGLNMESGGQTNGGSRVEYLKEATVVMDLMGNKEIKVEDIIKDVTEKMGFGKLLAVRLENGLEYALTITSVHACDVLLGRVEIKEQLCRVRRLTKEYTVSFLHIPFYVEAKTIEDKLKAWGVTPTVIH